jgi:hypothetical protein
MDDERYTTNFSMLFFSLSSAEAPKKYSMRSPTNSSLVPHPVYSLILAKISESLNKKYS